MRSSVMEVNIENFKYNVKNIEKLISNGTKIMPVIKDNAYGTHINYRMDILNEFDIVAVALIDEGIKLRKYGYEKEIFILNPPYIEELKDAVINNLTIGISNIESVEALSTSNARVHIEIETGMNRTGITLQELPRLLEQIKKYPNIKVEGIYTHMSSADTDSEYTKMQIKEFENAVELVKKYFDSIKYVHMSASNGLLKFPEAHFNLVRPGMIMYGYESGDGILDEINLEPICKLKSKITFLKTVEKDTSIGYSRSYKTNKKTKIATIPIGYGDGLKRCLSNIGEVFINGVKAPIIGKICMDSFMVDVTNVPEVKLGDDVWIWDNENITVYDIAAQCNTSAYEIISTISDRIPRVFI